MCFNSSSILRSPLHSAFCHPRPSKRQNLRLGRLCRRKRLLKEAKEKKRARVVIMKAEMELKNLKLYMENRSIIEENEKLKKKALLLHQENQALLFQLQIKKSSLKTNSDINR
ncbi:protein LITTLE ZIPPER 2-like [Alnus glutinosa]|uniref:protein LITTLE ZIPPER 2-like n=1 Tax=Alnus glutinosa TaxID=3517 RepID=UPI002D7A33C9|nr:protein LITTLE ZIPPER 2-like [Alnus glutinosa]